jgi:glucose-1-phosphate thymidylyltransferase
MKGILLAGGTGSRLYPLTKVTNKHLLPVGREPMIFYPLRRLLEAGIREIMVVTGTEHMGDVIGLLGSGKELGAELTYRVQDEAGGIAQALHLCHAFVPRGERMAVILGDNIFTAPISDSVARFEAQPGGARLVLARVPNPARFGVVAFGPEPERRLVRIEEKPATPPSSYAVTGLYFYDHRVFDIISTLSPSARGELEITDVNNTYLSWGELDYDLWDAEWTDAGTFASLQRANQLLAGDDG